MSDVSMLDLKAYSSYFANGNGTIAGKYGRVLTATDNEHYERIAGLSKDTTRVDTPLEISLLSYAAGVVDVRPIEADAILPANNPRAAGLKLGSAVLKELTEIRFLDPSNTAAVGRYEGMLRFISERNGVSRAEIDAYYRQGIGALIAAEVDAQFNKISFLIDRTKTVGSSYGAVLTRNTQNQYILSYEGYFNGAISTKTLSGASLDDLLAKMAGNRDFVQDDINQVRSQAALIPATLFNRWRGYTPSMVNPYELLTNALVNFYLDPNGRTPAGKNYDVLRGILARGQLAEIVDRDTFITKLVTAISSTLEAMSPGLYARISRELLDYKVLVAVSEIPNDPRYGIFTLTQTAGEEIFVSKKRQAGGLVQVSY
ncbi:hypothetical protein NO1_0246 [Candidatus Termititenax aidoneus]|uniref:Uncharacterized protein n=1 Tax=Termititenax aidoneus TaxID=2218524 RepID=A0A388T8S0_TERA1|nr:hypothetical protein NO1_0246 [Candidatus Termititenax aidoneus]